jgi:diguanylate cyclase (GGDEF)-like protein
MDTLPTVLIIDDSPPVIRLLTSLVEGKALVHFAKNGAEGIKLAKKLVPTVILLDLDMPGMNGLDVCRELKNDPDTRDCAILIVTGHNNDAMEIAALEAGAVDFIGKPVNGPIVQARVQTHLTLQKQSATLRELADHDGLTGLFNRRYFDQSLETECRRHRRQNQTLGLALIDIDHFKLYNDHYGHLLGDDTLKLVAKTLKKVARRPGEIVARYGGEEFAVILPNVMPANLQATGQHLCDQVRQLAIPHAHSKSADVVTISVGIACLTPTTPEAPSQLLAAADAALYQAKAAGRDRTIVSVL